MIDSVTWQDVAGSGIVQRLRDSRVETLLITGVPNLRLEAECRAASCLAANESLRTVGELREQMRLLAMPTRVCPDELIHELAVQGYVVQTGFSSVSQAAFGFDLLVSRQEISWPVVEDIDTGAIALSSNPLRNRAQQVLLQRLRENWLSAYLAIWCLEPWLYWTTFHCCATAKSTGERCRKCNWYKKKPRLMSLVPKPSAFCARSGGVARRQTGRHSSQLLCLGRRFDSGNPNGFDGGQAGPET